MVCRHPADVGRVGALGLQRDMSPSEEGEFGVFSRAAPTYNAVGPRHFTYYAQRLVEFVGVRGGDRVLDVATGTGEVLLAAAEHMGETGQIVGIDLAEPMLEQAAATVRNRQVENAELRVMDAEKLDFPAESFDLVLCSFGLSSLPQKGLAVAGFRRVLRPGGRLGLVDAFGWYFQHDPRWQWQEDVFRSFGALRENDQEDNKGATLAAIVERAEFTGVELIEDSYDLIFHDEEEWWRWAWSHGTRRLFEAVPPSKLGELRRQLGSGLPTCREGDGLIHGTMRATLVRAQRS